MQSTKENKRLSFDVKKRRCHNVKMTKETDID